MLFPMLNVLHIYISTFRSMCAVLSMVAFCSSLMSCFPGMLLRHFLNDFEMIPSAPIINGLTFVFTFHTLVFLMLSIYIFKSSRLLSRSYFHLIIIIIIIIIIRPITRYIKRLRYILPPTQFTLHEPSCKLIGNVKQIYPTAVLITFKQDPKCCS